MGMRIGIDCRELNEPNAFSGIAFYIRELVGAIVMHESAIGQTFVLFVYSEMRPWVEELIASAAEGVTVESVYLPAPPWERKWSLPFWHSHIVASWIFRKAQLDVLHSPAHVTPLFFAGPRVVTVHDLAIYAHPEWFAQQSGFSQKFLVPYSVTQADAVIAVSDATASDVRREFAVDKEQVHVVYEAPAGLDGEAPSDIRSQYGLAAEDEFFFFLGTLEPRKNVDGLLRGFDVLIDRLESEGAEHMPHLLIAGKEGWRMEHIDSAFDALKHPEYVHRIGTVTPEQKIALLQEAIAFVFPSFYEGFGLPVVESLQLGTPVLTTKRGALPEVAGDGAIYIDPEDVADITKGLHQLLYEAVRAPLIAFGKEQVAQLSWGRAAGETLAVYAAVASAQEQE